MTHWQRFMSAVLVCGSLLGPRLMPAHDGDIDEIVRAMAHKFKMAEGSGQAPSIGDQLAQIQGALAQSRQGRALSEEDRRLLSEIGSGGVEVHAPVLEDLLARMPEVRTGGRVADLWDRAGEFYGRHRARVRLVLWLLPAVLLTIAVAGRAADRPQWTAFVIQNSQSLASPWLGIVAFGSLALAWITKSNPWAVMPAEFYMPQVLMVLIGVGLVKTFDPEAPVYDPLAQSLTAPALSMAFVTLLPAVQSYLN